MNDFDHSLKQAKTPLLRSSPNTLQLNIGKLCNLTCSHCHVNAGPARKEIMTKETIDKILPWFEQSSIETLDLTGGTPEMIPDFRYFIEEVRRFSTPRKIITRLNATIISEEGFQWIPEFHAQHEIEIIASMPCYQPDNVNAQRGDGVFDRSIEAFQILNKLGYGSTLPLHFVYNPGGASLPPEQKELEQDYKREMKKHFDISFHNLYCIANMPIARFASYLKRNNQLEDYMELLRQSFNPATIESLMCRNTINASWIGEVFDCDFNQMLKLPTQSQTENLKVWDIDLAEFSNTPIRTGNHCFGCTAGSGSSCGGSLAS